MHHRSTAGPSSWGAAGEPESLSPGAPWDTSGLKLVRGLGRADLGQSPLFARVIGDRTIGYMMGVPVAPWQPMGRDECIDLLKTATCGRLALTVNAMPSVVPVAIELSGGDAILRSLIGSQVIVHPDQVVALEAGCLDEVADRRWSVVILGMLVVDKTDAESGGAGASPRFRLSTRIHVRVVLGIAL